jgi:hypothetical protein
MAGNLHVGGFSGADEIRRRLAWKGPLVPWVPDFFLPLEPEDPGNSDRLDPAGERIRMRFNKEGSRVVDFVVQYETPIDDDDGVASHTPVLRSDGSHGPHFDQYDRFGRKRTVPLPSSLGSRQVVDYAVAYIRASWRRLRDEFYEGL